MKSGLSIDTGPRHRTMAQYIGLDVSTKQTAISIRQEGKRIWRGKCASDPQLIAAAIRKRAPQVRRVVFETGPLSVWFYHALTAEGLPAICIDARHAKAALDMAANKTDANDADGLAHLAEVGFYREVRVKGFDSMLIHTLITARRELLKMRLQISNQIRGLVRARSAHIKALRAEVIDPKIAQFRGRLVNTAGDSLLIEFPSAVDALQFAVETQERITARNTIADLQPSRSHVVTGPEEDT